MNRQKVNASQVICGLCESESQPGENFVQCDSCDVDYHFNCVEISEIGETEEWRCHKCLKQNATNQTVRNESKFSNVHDRSSPNKASPNDNQTSNITKEYEKIVIQADVHQPPFEDIVENYHQNRSEDNDETEVVYVSDDSKQRSDPTPGREYFGPKSIANHHSTNLNDRARHQSSICTEQHSGNRPIYHSTGKLDRQTTHVRGGGFNGELYRAAKSTGHEERQTVAQRATDHVRLLPVVSQPKTSKTRTVKSVIEDSIESKSVSSMSSSKELHLRYAKDKFDLQELIDEEILTARMDAIRAKELRAKQLLDEIYKSKSERMKSTHGSTTTSKSHVVNWVKDQQSRTGAQTFDEDIQRFSKRIDELGFDMSISLNEAEAEALSRKQTRTDSRHSKLDRPAKNENQSSKLVQDNVSQSYRGTKFHDFDQIRVPSSRSTMLPGCDVKDKKSVATDSKIKDSSSIFATLRKPFENQSVNKGTGDQPPTKMENVTFHPNISQSYRNMYPSHTESHKGTYYSTDRPPPSSSHPIYTTAKSSRPIMSSTTAKSVDIAQRIRNDKTFSMDQTPSNLPVLSHQQIAARQALSKWIPKFDGNPCDWPNFIKRFENTTALCGFCADENLERLDKCLEGVARESVKSQLLMPECVPEIIQILFERYGRPELVMKATLNAVRNEPIIKHDRLAALADYGYKVHSACNIIENLGLEYYLYNPELIQEVLEKLPSQTRINFAVYCENIEVVTLRTLADWMRALSRMINRITPIDAIFPNYSDDKKQSDKKSNHRSHDRRDDHPKSKSGYLNVHDGAKSSTVESKPSCVICSNDCKRLEECSQFSQLNVNQRWDSLKQHNLCRRCLKNHPGDCVLSKECGINGCVFKHNPLLHKDKQTKKISKNSRVTDIKNASPSENTNKSVKTGSNNAHFRDDVELFRTALVEVHHKNRKFATFAMLDEASSFTLMERKIANELEVTGSPETICLLWTKGMHRQENTEVADLEISGKVIVNGKIVPTERYPLKEVNIVEKLELPQQTLPIDEFKRKYEHLTDLPIIGYKNARPTILIGIKNARLAVPLETIEGKSDDPIATRSRLGWQIYGTSKGDTTGFVNIHRVVKCPCQDRDEELHKLVKDHFTIENFGVVASSASLDSKENEKALKMMKEHTVRKDGRFETKLLWKNHTYSLPDSYPMAMKRLSCLENKGAKVIDTINESIKDYLEKGYVSKLSESESEITNNRTWYLPLFTVVNPKKPEKLRTVFDAAARVKGVSLNSVLYTGPDLSVSIVDILRRFREHRIAVNGDIKEMYHQVLVNEEDRNSQRFIWRNGDKTRKPDVYVMNVLTFGATCSPSLAQFVKNLNATEFQSEYPLAANAIIRNHYIDDLLDGADTEEEAIQLLKDVKYVHKMGGFEIRNFKSNSSKVLQGIGETNHGDQRISVDKENPERVLGMFWETKSDCFTFSLKYTKIVPEVFNKSRLPTKREMLSLVMSIYDPLGLLSHYLIHVKIILQDVWRAKIKWDERIPEELKSNWHRWLDMLPNVERVKIPRWYSKKLSPTIKKNVELHVFVDASEHAYSAAAYLRIENEDGVAVTLIGSKARVTPLKYLSIPRKELLASVLGTRFSQSVREGIRTKIDRRIIWSDSTTVLIWLQSEHKKYHQFVAHRIGEILESTEHYEWKWVPTDQNVADEATKWKNPSFESTSRWFTGPDFLKRNESEWPKLTKKIRPNGTSEEMKVSCSHSRLVIPSVIDINRISKFKIAVRTIATAVRWGKVVIAKVRKSEIPRGPFTQEELISAETILFRQAQWEGYTDELISLTKNLKKPNSTKGIDKSSSIYDCMPYLDELGVLRMDGRIDRARALSQDTKNPIILPRNHRVTKLVMLSQHEKLFHRNHETAINELIQRFYIPRIRVAYRSVRWNCMTCKVNKCRPRPPLMADLPAFRFETGIRAFTFTGIDFFGPMNVMIGRRSEKRWGVLFTCLTTRAIHIELASSLDTQTCIMKLRNFINLRGRPSEIYSDNGTNFKGANNELLKEMEKLNLEELSASFTSCYSKWIFNPPASPHMGGLWERMIRTVKECLEQSITTRTPKEEVLDSLLKEIMNVVNSRPLTFVPIDSEESEALTPNHFILGTSNGLKPPGKFKIDSPYLQSSWKEIQRCTNIFWKRFINEYVPTLTRRTKWFENVKPLEVGDIVIEFDENQPRNTYRKAKVVETIVGSRNQTRRAKIQYSDGSTLWRPAVRLGVLDINPPAPTHQGSLDLQKLKTGGRNVGATNQNVDKKYTTTLSADDVTKQSFA